MSALALLAQAAGSGDPPSLPLFLGAAVASFVVLVLTPWAGRNVESGGVRLLLFLVSLVPATAVVLAVLLAGSMSFDVIREIG